MSTGLIGLFRALVRRQALQRGRMLGLYRRLCRPGGEEWAEVLRRHGDLHSIGADCSIQTNVTITDPCHVRLGRNVRLSGCTLFGHDGSVNMLARAFDLQIDRVGRIDIRDHVFIGHQAIVLPGVTIGPRAIVAAGAVVSRDVPPDAIVAGNPARVVGSVSELAQRRARETASLPWAGLLERKGPQGASVALKAQRIRHFFPDTPQES